MIEKNIYNVDLVKLNILKNGIELFYGKKKMRDINPKIIQMVNKNFEKLLLE